MNNNELMILQIEKIASTNISTCHIENISFRIMIKHIVCHKHL